ncbi:hypothetical protein Tco_1424305 [Tanacetum coccineum]
MAASTIAIGLNMRISWFCDDDMLDKMILGFDYWILGKSLDEGLVPLMFEKDVVNLLNYVPRYRELEVYIDNGVSSIESHVTERLSQGKGVVIEEILEENMVETIIEKEEGKLLLLE